MTTATEVHPRNGDDGTIGSAIDAEEFVDDYLREQYNTTLEDATDDGLLSRFIG